MADHLRTLKELFHMQLQAAEKLWDGADCEGCTAAAKKNLAELHAHSHFCLPCDYYIAKNCLLIAWCLDDWDDNDEMDAWKLTAEQAYTRSHDEATKRKDADALKALAGLRGELDVLNKFHNQHMAEGGDDDGEGEDGDEEDDSEDNNDNAEDAVEDDQGYCTSA